MEPEADEHVEIDSDFDRQVVIQRLESCTLAYITQLVASTNSQMRPCISMVRKSKTAGKADIIPLHRPLQTFNSRLTSRTTQRHAHMWRVAVFLLQRFLLRKKVGTQREVFYSLLRFYSTQQQVNDIVIAISRWLRVSRFSLGVIASARGFIYGPLWWERRPNQSADHSDGETQDTAVCNVTPVAISQSLLNHHYRSDARYALVVEKEGVFNYLVESKFAEKMNCILITGMGYPSHACRALVKQLCQHLGLQVFGLFDYNPFGVDILMCYRREEPSIQWLGLSSADVRSLPPSLHVTFQPFTERDDKLMTKLLRYDVVIADDSMKESLQQMQQHRQKLELQSLHLLGLHHLCTFIQRKILRRKRSYIHIRQLISK